VINRCDYLLSDILFIALCTLLSNGEDFEDMVEFGCQRIDWLKTKIELPNGIPSHDTFNRVFQIIAPQQLKKVLKEDGEALIEHVRGQLVNFDGKKLRSKIRAMKLRLFLNCLKNLTLKVVQRL